MINADRTEEVIHMHRIDSRTVELTDLEMKVSDRFQANLSKGYSIMEAAEEALHTIVDTEFTRFTRDFIEYISDGTLSGSKRTRRMVRTYKGRTLAAADSTKA